jgi:phenylalanyl-tRNA synthetase beta chain
MKISYQWLQTYFAKKLPEAERLAERLAFSFAEVEGVEKRGDDWVLDVKVLPDRACYALSHCGVAREVAALLDWKIKEKGELSPRTSRGVRTLSVRVEDKKACPRYRARIIENVSVDISPAWLCARLEAIGERSINNIVDATNFTMFDIGQPLHAFDADKVTGGIVVRRAKKGEALLTLDGKELVLEPNALVIADNAGVLALAGVKGGKRAEVTKETKNIILEAASFDPGVVRRASQTHGVRTESSRRFENNLSPWLAGEGSDACAALIRRFCSDARCGAVVDIFPKKQKPRSIIVNGGFIRTALGMDISDKEIRTALARLALSTHSRGKTLVVVPSPERRDIMRREDVVEEVGRMLGYDQIPEESLPVPPQEGESKRERLSEDIIRDLLVAEGFSEVFTSSFAARGEVEIEKPLAADKAFARSDLFTNFYPSLLKNYANAPLLGVDVVRQYEIGSVFTEKGERRALIMGAMSVKNSVRDIVGKLEKILGRKLVGTFCGGENVYECTI